MAKPQEKHFRTAFDKTRKVFEDIGELDPKETQTGALTTAMTNLMLAQSINQLRIDMNENFANLVAGLQTNFHEDEPPSDTDYASTF